MSTDADRDNGTVTKPGVYPWMPDATYHADPVPGGSLSASGAKTLLKAPAKFAYEREHGRPDKREFDVGHAAHLLALGAGPELHVTERETWNTNAVKEEVAAARLAGKVPIKSSEFEAVSAMVAALLQHPIAAELFDPATMRPEVSVFWRDPWAPAVMRRARLDAISQPDADGGQIIVDYKTTTAADPDSISRAMWNYGYALQAAWYLDAASSMPDRPLVIADRFLFVFQEKSPPYLVTVAEPNPDALRVGEKQAREAVDLYAACVGAGRWPGYVPDDEIPLIGLPPWVERQHTTDEYEEIL
jgi:hypothetical protein